ncbi:UNVERIFIED_CONTAM: hypothetical protein FKN15_073739 [Acipenser sinensis]
MGILTASILTWLCAAPVMGDSKGVTTSLTAKWPSTPLLLEASEFLAEESQDMFWDFVEVNQEIGPNEHGDTDHSYYHLILKRASQFLTHLQLNMLKFALSLRAYSSTVQSFQQIAANEPPPSGCKAFLNVHGEMTCNQDSLKALLETASERPKPYLFKGDHRFPSSSPDTPVVILYAQMGNKEFSKFHQLLVSKANSGEITYILRHFIVNPSQSKVFLSGYGVELAIKNQEYKAKDDTQVQALTVNKRLHSSAYSVFDTLRNEARVMEGLRSLLIETSVIHDILKLNVQPSDSDYAVDIRNPAIYWINNLETDSRYDSWPSSVQELLRPTFPGVIRQIRKNFHNFVIIVDPTDESTAELINVVEMFFNNHIPLRIGLVFVVDDSEDIDGLQDTGVALLRAFNYISEEMDNHHAFQAITAMYNKVRTGEKLKVENVISVLEKKYPYMEVSSILGADSAYDRNRKEGRSYYEQTGVGPLPVALYNGMPYQRDQLDADELETVTMHKILETTSFYQRAVYLVRSRNIESPFIVMFVFTDNYFVDDYARFTFLDAKEKTAAVANSMNYLTKKGKKLGTCAVKVRPKEEEVYFDVVAVMDPATRAAQKLAPLLIVLNQLINMNLRVLMNCQSKLSDLPLKSFYRYVMEPEVTFMVDNSFAPGPIAKFLDMPHSPLFTLNVNPPESWMVESVKTRYDLDNIYLEEGYFQLKANPGAWVLKLRKGRSEEIYKIYSHEGTDSPADADDLIVVLNNFKSKIIKVKVQKKSDKINEELLSEGNHDSDSGFWESLTRGFTGGAKPDEMRPEKDDVINIFSVASGHLYERFLRIMMLSVLKHTKTPVKFWFLKNYLSPAFKEFIPYMAEEYGFQYELVQYKWPRWLHQQTEKQRIIWGYKILFLDVLFPLAVDKFLFVDADQIVRTDLKELRDFDLEGAPYGYTPFCESRREMDGYRFWKSGYWASHLAGRKYHISALYVVDLKKFRKIAAGDRLRGQYQGLSQDPNSLSNLDQDLPNNMIHQVPIKSLPQEWLWCETWCDESSKKWAKTIDLCNNPQTKEPKLQAAVRIVGEWSEYDQEIKKIYNKFTDEKEKGSVPVNNDTASRSKAGETCADSSDVFIVLQGEGSSPSIFACQSWQ